MKRRFGVRPHPHFSSLSPEQCSYFLEHHAMTLFSRSGSLAEARSRRRRTTLVALAGGIGLLNVAPAEAELGPCTIAAPTTINVHLFVSDLENSARWYQDNVGLEAGHRILDAKSGVATLKMGRPEAGVTLVQAPSVSPHRSPELQMLCFVVESPPAPQPGSRPLYLTDPDGAAVELAPRSHVSRALK